MSTELQSQSDVKLYDVDEDIVIRFLNDNCSDLDTYKKTKETLARVEKKTEIIKNKLDACKEETRKCIINSRKSADTTAEQLTDLCKRQMATVQDGKLFAVDRMEPILKSLKDLFSEVEELEKLQLYLSWIIQINKLSQEIETQLSKNSIGIAVDLYRSMNNIHDRLKTSACSNLLQFVRESSQHWFRLLCDISVTEFNSILVSMKWPFPNGISAPAMEQYDELMEHFQTLVKFLINIDSLHERGDEDIHLLTKCLARPLEKRFHFHFYGNRQTNNIEKPEWFFTQILNWIRDHTPFIENTVQILVDREVEDTRNIKEEFIKLLVQLVIDKMACSIPLVIKDDELFPHWIDEALFFDKELKVLYGYTHAKFNCVRLVTEGDYLSRWLEVEKKYFNKNVEKLLEAESAWKPRYQDLGDVSDNKVPEVVEDFMLQLAVMTERFEQISCPESRLQFLDLQLTLLDGFVQHLKDTANAESSRPSEQCFCSIINGVQYMQDILGDWNEKTVFLRLNYARQMHCKSLSLVERAEEITTSVEQTSDGVFNDVIEALRICQQQLSILIVEESKEMVSKHIRLYKNQRWHCMKNLRDFVVPVMSDLACPLVLFVRDHLAHLQELLSCSAFNFIWPLLAKELDKLIFDNVVLGNHFNDGGAGQLNYDVTRNIFVLFGEYTQKPQSYFKRTKEALALLNLLPGTAALLKELITSFEKSRGDNRDALEKDVKKVLGDINVAVLSVEDCKIILNSRIDLPKT